MNYFRIVFVSNVPFLSSVPFVFSSPSAFLLFWLSFSRDSRSFFELPCLLINAYGDAPRCCCPGEARPEPFSEGPPAATPAPPYADPRTGSVWNCPSPFASGLLGLLGLPGLGLRPSRSRSTRRTLAPENFWAPRGTSWLSSVRATFSSSRSAPHISRGAGPFIFPCRGRFSRL